MAVRIMTVGATHPAFQHRVTLWQVELGVRREMTLETGRGVATRIEDPLACTRRRYVPAPGPVTRFTPGLPCHFEMILAVEPAVGAAGEYGSVIRMAIGAGRIAHKCRPFNVRRNVQSSIKRAARGQAQKDARPQPGQKPAGPKPLAGGTHRDESNNQWLRFPDEED
jgi:hypothetical protein